MQSKRILMLLAVVILLLGGCTSSGSAPSFTKDTYPRVDGSTVTIPLSEALYARLTAVSEEEARLHVLHNKTHEAYLNLIKGNTDVIFVTGPSMEELALAEAAGITLEVIPIVSEGFVFLVGAENPVTNLTQEEIIKIYTGEITNWSEVGGKDMPITPYQRPVNSGSQTGFLEHVMKENTPMDPPTTQIIAGMGDLIDTVAAYTDQVDGIGYSYYYYTTEMWGNDRVKLLSIDGVAPGNETIQNGSYPYTTAYYAVLRGSEEKGSAARKLVDYILSKEGQTLMEENGYVRVKP